MEPRECKSLVNDTAQTGASSGSGETNKVDAKFLGGCTSKSGLPDEGLDRKRIDEIIVEASRGSKFYTHQRQREQCLLARIDTLRQKRAVLEKDAGLLRRAHHETAAWIDEVKAGRDLGHLLLHIDMDAFFAAVESLRDPSLRDKPMAVGGNAMLCTANYEARKFGVTSAMPGYIARRLCPQLVMIPPDFRAYREASQRVRHILRDYDPDMTSHSLDEASLDITHYFQVRSRRDPTLTVASLLEEIRRRVRETTQLTCSIGAAPNRQLAKLCSNINKPDGQFYLEPDANVIMAFIEKQPTRRISGVGKVMARTLSELLGINTCKDIVEQATWIRLLLRPIQSSFLLRSALGLGQAFGEGSLGGDARKSMSTERTFKTIRDLGEMQQMLGELCEQLAIDIQKQQQKNDDEHLSLLGGRTVGIKMKTSTFEVHTRAITLEQPISGAGDIYQQALVLLIKNKPSDLRLLGVRLSGLVYEGGEEEEDEDEDREAGEQEEVKYKPLDYFILPSDTPVQRPECPICRGSIDVHPDDTLRINEHIDRCLNKQSTGETRTLTSKRSKKDIAANYKGSLDVFFGNNKAR